MMDGGLADVELSGDIVLRPTTLDRRDDGSTACGIPITLLMATSEEEGVFRSRLRPSDRDQVAQN
jgi:hypothetical protein